MGKKRKVDTRAGAVAKAAEELEAVVKMSPPVQLANNNKRKKESGSVTPRHQYPDSDCESGTIRSRLSFIRPLQFSFFIVSGKLTMEGSIATESTKKFVAVSNYVLRNLQKIWDIFERSPANFNWI